jgi:hypothetical protein
MKNQIVTAIIHGAGFVEYGASSKLASGEPLNATETEKITRMYVMPMDVMDKRLETLAEVLVRECAIYAAAVSGNQEVGKHLLKAFLGTDDDLSE